MFSILYCILPEKTTYAKPFARLKILTIIPAQSMEVGIPLPEGNKKPLAGNLARKKIGEHLQKQPHILQDF
ncbi:MAG: hypothetical protein ACOCPS_01600 [Desulfonatronovibrio sp.]